jgi:hypothetical protein
VSRLRRSSPINTNEQRASGERIAIIGAGATGTYTLHALTNAAQASEIVVFENGDRAGPGLPYAEHLNDLHALSNIAGIEIPPLVETINAWALRQPRARLEAWGIADSAGDDRAFFPRVVLGGWLADQFALIAERSPFPVTLRTGVDVVDVVAMPDGCRVEWRRRGGAIEQEEFDRVIVATGYGPTDDTGSDAAQRTGKAAGEAAQEAGAAHIAVLGSSLSGIDAVVAAAMTRGRFEEREQGLAYIAAEPWRATMLSRNGLLPEADFWFPHPLPDLAHFTPATAAAAMHGEEGDLDRVFAQFAKALIAQAPEWAEANGVAEASADDFADRYFAARLACNAWDHARENLADVRAWQDDHRTPAWRIAILKAHEVFATVIPSLQPGDLARLHRGLKRVFTDNYAAVPHLSIERILALHDAGVLDVVALGNDYDIRPGGGRSWSIRSPKWSAEVQELIDARGPQAAALNHFPFPTLRMQLCATALEGGQDWKSGLNPDGDLTLGEQDPSLRRVHLCALPFLLRNRPFVQGLVECAEMARVVARSIAASQACGDALVPSDEDLLGMLDKPSVILGDGAVITLAGYGHAADRRAEALPH